MRIIAGRFRGMALASVGKGDAAGHLRPTTDRVRESLFNFLEHGGFGDPVEEARVLDLFAGTGALGLEALSRGAAHATFVENGRVGARLIQENIAKLRVEQQADLIRRDATRLTARAGEGATLVFLDPPYGKNLGASALRGAERGGWIAQGAVIVWEENSAQEAPEGFERLDARRFGETWITVLRKVT